MESQLNVNCRTLTRASFNPFVLTNIKTDTGVSGANNTSGQIDDSTLVARSNTHACIRTHAYARTSSRCSRAIRRDVPGRVGTGGGGTERDGECETRLCGQAERVLDCGSPLCPTHPPTAPRRNAPLAPAGSAYRGSERESRKGPRMEGQVPSAGVRGAPHPAITSDP